MRTAVSPSVLGAISPKALVILAAMIVLPLQRMLFPSSIVVEYFCVEIPGLLVISKLIWFYIYNEKCISGIYIAKIWNGF